MPKNFRAWRLLVLLVFACCGLAWIMVRVNPFFLNRVDLAAFDLFQESVQPGAPPEKIMAVIATDKGIRDLGHWPLPRSMHAEMLGKLGLAKTVAVDILFPERSNADDDALLAATVRQMGNVVLALHISAAGTGQSHPVMPFPELAAAAESFGFTNVRPEADGIFRNAYLFWGDDSLFIPSFPLAAWMHATGAAPGIVGDTAGFRVKFPDFSLVTSEDAVFRVHHPDPEIPIYEYADVLAGKVPPETSRDAVVFVGASAAGTDDFFPVGSDRQIAGVLYNAHAALTLFHGWIPQQAAPWLRIAATMALMALGLLIGLFIRARQSWLWLLGGLACYLAVTAGLFYLFRLWLPPAVPVLSYLSAYVLAIWYQLHSLSKRMEVQKFSVESQLALGHADFDPQKTSLADYLAENWKDIKRWSGLAMPVPLAAADDPLVAECLVKLAGDGEEHGTAGAQVGVVHGLRPRENYLLLFHPSWEGEDRHYTILSWRGKKGLDELKSISALVFSAAMRYRALAEGKARRELFLGVIRLIMSAVDAKDPTTAGHSERVAILARELPVKLELPQKEIEDIYLSGLLHDVGKIGIPDRILNFPGRLSDEDRDIIYKHPTLGLEIMHRIKLPEVVTSGILEHHERMDGRGYPSGVEGGGLSLAGRILKVADVFDALRSKRQYKDALPLNVVYDILRAGAGDEFDPLLISLVLNQPFTDLHKADSSDSHIWELGNEAINGS